MSLDVMLYRKLYLSYDEGKTYEESRECVYDANITHNLSQMAFQSDLYDALWSPEDKGYKKAEDIIESLRKGLKLLESDPGRFKKFNPGNGWGDYEGLVCFVRRYLTACLEYPTAEIQISR